MLTLACHRPDLVLHARDASPARGGKVVRIEGVVVDVARPSFDSPSMVGEDSKVTIRVPKGSVPGHPKATIVAYHYDRDPLVRAGWMEGDAVTLVFSAEGRLHTITPNAYLPATGP